MGKVVDGRFPRVEGWRKARRLYVSLMREASPGAAGWRRE